MRKTASKNIVPSESYVFLKIWVAIKLLYTQNFNTRFLKEYKRYIYLDTIHARNLKFVMYLPSMTFHKYYVAISKILLFGLFMATKKPKSNMATIFGHIIAHKTSKIS